MPELKNRTKEENELAAILLLIFASEDMDFWLSGFHEPQWFEARLQETTITSRFRSMSRRVQDQMLRELRREVIRAPITERMRQMAEFFKYEIAGRMARRHAEWLERFQEKQRQRERERRPTETEEEEDDEDQEKPADDPDEGDSQDEDDPLEPTIEDIYPRPWAEREAASTITDWVSATEITTGGVIEDTHNIVLEAIWQTEPGACPICEPLDQQPREVWSKRFPRGPKAHPNCLLPGTDVGMPFGMSATIKSQYSGPVCDLCIGGQYFLSVTPRHPIPTHNGMVAAGDLKKGDVVYVARSEMIGRYTGVAEYLHAAAKATHETIYEEPRPGMLHGEAATMVDPLEIAMIPGTRPSPEMETNDAIVRALKHKSIQYTPASVTFNHRRHYEGPVYDFSAQTLPFYIAGDILVSNCRCWLSWSEVLNP